MSPNQTTYQGSPSSGGFSFAVPPQGQRALGAAPHESLPRTEDLEPEAPMDQGQDGVTSGAHAGSARFDAEFPPLLGAAAGATSQDPASEQGWTKVGPKPKTSKERQKFKRFPPPIVGSTNIFNSSVNASIVAPEDVPPPATTTGVKRTREQVSATPFLQGRTTKLRAVAEPGDRPSRSTQEEKEQEEAKAAAEKEKASFLEEFAADTQAPRTGQLRVVRPSSADEADRYCPCSKAMQLIVHKQAQLDTFLEARSKQILWVWVGVYGQPTPSDDDVSHFVKALRHIESAALIEDLDVDEYQPILMKKGSGSSAFLFPVFCTTMIARDRILAVPTFAYAEGSLDRTFFVQSDKSWGQRVVLNFENAPTDEQEFLKGVQHSLKDVIAWKSGKDSAPASFRYTRLEWSAPRVPRTSSQTPAPSPAAAGNANVKSFRWRVSFAPNREVMVKGWRAPAIAGFYASRGEILVKEAPFCTLCVSYSHADTHCNWWKVAGVITAPKQHPGYKPLDWKKVSTFNKSATVHSASSSRQGKGKEVFTVVENDDEDDLFA